MYMEYARRPPVAAAYGWVDYTPEMEEDEILKRFLKLNHDRASD